VCVWRDSSWT